jgi:hypothetical protein
MEKA